jgi:hypothetical protein
MEDYTLVRYMGEQLRKPVPGADVKGDGVIQDIMNEAARRKVGGGVTAIWTVREKQDGFWVPVRRNKNILTTYGLTALVGAYSGSFVVPQYLVYDGTLSSMGQASNIGDSVVYVVNSPILSGDTQLTLSVGLASQETITISSTSYPVTAGGQTCTQVNLTGTCVNAHSNADPVVRTPALADTMTQIPNEQYFDPTLYVGQRAVSTAGYSGGGGNFVIQFYLLSTQCNGTNGGAWFGNVGTSDTLSVGTGNLHNLYSLGYTHTNANDVEVDVVITIANS